MTRKVLAVRLDDHELAIVDEMRGALSRAEWIRQQIARAHHPSARGEARADPTGARGIDEGARALHSIAAASNAKLEREVFKDPALCPHGIERKFCTMGTCQ